MYELNEEQVQRFLMERKDFNLTMEQEALVQKLYDKVKLDPINDISTQEQYGVLNKIVVDVSRQAEEPRLTEARITNYLSSNKHMNYYEQVLGVGESEKIERALASVGLSTAELIGVRKQGIKTITNNGLRIEQVTNKDINPNDTDSLYVVFFNLEYMGKTIYSFARGLEDVLDDTKVDLTETFIHRNDLRKIQNAGYDTTVEQNQQNKRYVDGKKRKEFYNFSFTDGENTFREYTRTLTLKNGNVKSYSVFKKNGKYVSKSDIFKDYED